MEEKMEKDIEKKEREVLERGKISLLLSNYDDIFSDFDPRYYGQRALSVDFLDEMRRATREIGEDGLELRLLLPREQRKVEHELLIKKRLKEHFKKHAGIIKKEKIKISLQGFSFIGIGIIFMFVAACILFYYEQSSLLKNFFIVLLEPGGWFLFWEGLDLVIFESKKIKPDLEFYRKMIKAEIIFSHYK